MIKKKFFLFILFILLIFGLLTFQSIKGKGSTPGFIHYPLTLTEQVITTVIRSIKNGFNTYIFIIGKEDENKRLLQTINEMKQRENQWIEAMAENRRLKKILDLKSRMRSYVVTAEVIARDPTNWFQIVWINKGSRSGIKKDMVAVTPEGPVGKIQRVFENRAAVLLITDVNSSVAVRLQESRVEGIMEGRGDNHCNLKYISKEAVVAPGERIVTSGLDGIYPEGLLIGQISSVKKNDEEMFQIIEVTPSQELNALEELVILRR